MGGDHSRPEDWIDEDEPADLFEEEDRERIRTAASQRSETIEFFIRDAVLKATAEELGDDGHLECWTEGCEETFITHRQRRGHVGRSHSDNLPDGEFWCGICGRGPTTYTGVGAHHGRCHPGEDVRPLDHEPDEDELLAPGDVPDHMNPDLLERLYEECGGSYTEMCRQHDFEVTAGRVRHYLIEFGIHEATPQGTGPDGPAYRDPDFLKPRYEAADGNISEMHRELQRDGYAVAYRTLQSWLRDLGIHDVEDPPGRRHGKGGAPADDRDDEEPEPEPEPEPPDPVQGADPDDVDGELAYRLNWGRFGPPQGGTYHEADDCWVLHRSDSDREVWVLPRPVDELEGDDDWSGCGHCAGQEADESEGAAGHSDASAEDDQEPAEEPEPVSDDAVPPEPAPAEDNHEGSSGDELFEDLHNEPADPAPRGSPALALEDLGIDVDDPWTTEEQQEDPGDGDRLVENGS